MNHKWKKLKLKECSNILECKDRGILSLCNNGKPFTELVFFDTDCFCGCFLVTFKVCKCGDLIETIKTNNNGVLTITRKNNNCIEIVTLEGTLEIIEDEKDCCCHKKDECFKTVKLNVEKIQGKKFFKC